MMQMNWKTQQNQGRRRGHFFVTKKTKFSTQNPIQCAVLMLKISKIYWVWRVPLSHTLYPLSVRGARCFGARTCQLLEIILRP